MWRLVGKGGGEAAESVRSVGLGGPCLLGWHLAGAATMGIERRKEHLALSQESYLQMQIA
jgi:hypothetical protein